MQANRSKPLPASIAAFPAPQPERTASEISRTTLFIWSVSGFKMMPITGLDNKHRDF
jgi:hypothetical protein